jgi:hypothetical protein
VLNKLFNLITSIRFIMDVLNLVHNIGFIQFPPNDVIDTKKLNLMLTKMADLRKLLLDMLSSCEKCTQIVMGNSCNVVSVMINACDEILCSADIVQQVSLFKTLIWNYGIHRYDILLMHH